MVYMGSKAKYAEHIVPILQKAIDENDIKDITDQSTEI